VLGIDCNMKGKWCLLLYYFICMFMLVVGYAQIGTDILYFSLMQFLLIFIWSENEELISAQRSLIDLQDKFIRSNYERK